MEKDLINQVNGEIINKITNNLYSYSYTNEEPAEDVIVLSCGEIKVTLDLEREVTKNKDGIIDNCTVTAKMRKESAT